MAQEKKFQKRRPDGKFAASRKRNGQFAPNAPVMDGFRPPVSLAMPAHAAAAYEADAKKSGQSPVQAVYVAPATFEPLTPVEADRFAHAMVSAGRIPSSPADRATLEMERKAIEARFGSIDWAA